MRVMNDLLARLLCALDLVVVEREPNHTFYVLTPAPTWFTRAFDVAPAGEQGALAGAFPFLDDFIHQAAGAWAAGPHASIVSGPFSVDVDGEGLLLRATALTIDGRALLVLDRLTGAADARPVLQKARERMLEGEETARRIAALQTPAAALDRAVAALRDGDHGQDLGPVVEDLHEASARLQEAIAALTSAPERSRR
jgi:hypothetical protein